MASAPVGHPPPFPWATHDRGRQRREPRGTDRRARSWPGRTGGRRADGGVRAGGATDRRRHVHAAERQAGRHRGPQGDVAYVAARTCTCRWRPARGESMRLTKVNRCLLRWWPLVPSRETGSLRKGPVGGGIGSQNSGGGRPLLAGRLERVGERRGGVSDGRVGRHDLGQAVAGAGGIELLDCRIEARPEFVWTASSRSGAQLIWRSRALGTLDRSPGKPSF
jgi:hypothetical protein